MGFEEQREKQGIMFKFPNLNIFHHQHHLPASSSTSPAPPPSTTVFFRKIQFFLMGIEEQGQKQSKMVFCPNLQIFHHNREVPRGYVAILVGDEEESLKRFVIPLMFLSHPLFLKLLKDAEDEYGFKNKGLITIPCCVDEFKLVQEIINEETRNRHNHHNRHNNRLSCF